MKRLEVKGAKAILKEVPPFEREVGRKTVEVHVNRLPLEIDTCEQS